MMDMTDMAKQVRDIARGWLDSGEVKYVIGYEAGQGGKGARPIFIRDAGDADKLIWNSECYNNLTLYLVNEMKVIPPRGQELDTTPVGIVVKPCDSKTINELMKEHIVPRERVKIIGLTCTGVSDHRKPGSDEPAGKCTVCTMHNPAVADEVVGDPVEETFEDDYSDIAFLEEMSSEERLAYWNTHINRCVRCYACRGVCPLCYCEECVFDRTKPYKWIEKTVGIHENQFYHMVRAMHLAGRCIDCGECERSCPVDIPIRQLNRYLEKRALERFEVHPGANAEDGAMFGTCDVDDPGSEIW